MNRAASIARAVATAGRTWRPSRAFAALASAAPSSITRLDTSPRFSHAAVHNGVVYLTGQVPHESTFGAGAGKQTESVLAAIDSLLRRSGSDRTRLLNAQVFLTDLRDFDAMNEAYVKWLPAGCAPCRTTIGVAALANPNWKVEITVTAATKA